LAQSQNGSGKTLAFLLAGLSRVDPKISSLNESQTIMMPQFVVLTNVRELVTQTCSIA